MSLLKASDESYEHWECHVFTSKRDLKNTVDEFEEMCKGGYRKYNGVHRSPYLNSRDTSLCKRVPQFKKFSFPVIFDTKYAIPSSGLVYCEIKTYDLNFEVENVRALHLK